MRTLTLSGRPNGLPVFVLVWLGQFVSLLGSGLTEFALGVWVYQRTGSATQFARRFCSWRCRAYSSRRLPAR